jgi:tetratricopeptide (TPR) repeat protein
LPDEASRLEYWIRIKKTCPDDPDVLYELGRAYLMNDNILMGDECYRQAIKLDSARIILLLDLARYHIIKLQSNPGNPGEHPEAAEAYLSEYLESGTIQPIKAWCYARLATVNELAGKLEKAENCLEEARKLDQQYLKEDRLPPMMLYHSLTELSTEYYSYFDTY